MSVKYPNFEIFVYINRGMMNYLDVASPTETRRIGRSYLVHLENV